MDDIKFVDIHAHLSDHAFDSDRGEIISKLGEYIVLNSGEYPEENERILSLGQKYDNILPCIGLHPDFITRYGSASREKGFQYLFNNANKAFAISEVGLDFNKKSEEQIDTQKKIFMNILEIAEKNNKVCIVHSRKAMSSMLEIIPSFNVKIIMHNFEGNAEQHVKALDLGAFISVSTGVIKYTRDSFLRQLNLDHFFVETDSPVLSPDSGRNTPFNIPKLLEYIATVRKTDPQILKQKVYDNFKRLFNTK
ncbi:MAG: TatD family hydrolase [Candidatus Parvarchaeota archaeon]|nr:TatD family hydrolase [Candidatus Parvarchaeota archaeon]